MEFIRPKTTPRKNKGYLIIESDDSNIGDYTHWFPMMEKLKLKNTQWTGNGSVTCCFNANTGVTGERNKVTDGHLVDLQKHGYDIHAHGTHHIGLGRVTLRKEAKTGDTELFFNTVFNTGIFHGEPIGYPFTYRLINGNDEEVVKLTSHNNDDRKVTIETALSKSFPSGSYFELSVQGRKDLVEGCIADLRALGIEPKHYGFPYHAASYHNVNPPAVDYVNTLFETARGRYDGDNPLHNIQWSNLESTAIRPTTELSEVDYWLDRCAERDQLLILFGHGESDENTLACLERAITGAWERGITILSRDRAYNLFS